MCRLNTIFFCCLLYSPVILCQEENLDRIVLPAADNDNIVVSRQQDAGANERGCASLYFGGPQMDTIPDAVFPGRFGLEHFGFCVSGAGDFNNDGFDDMIVGTYDAWNAYIFLGGTIVDDEPDLILASHLGSRWFGESVSCAGDINGDGFSDVVVGDIVSGTARVFLGTDQLDLVHSLVLDIEPPGGIYAGCVSSAGDFNGDGYDDILVGQPGENRVWVFFGGDPPDTERDLTIREIEDHEFGKVVACAGDVNRDGYSDIMVGAPSRFQQGQVYIYFGNASPDNKPDLVITDAELRNTGYYLSGAGDVNRDGYDDILIGFPHQTNMALISYVHIYFGGEQMDTVPDVIISEPWFYFGAGVSGAGDLNHDGYDDILICTGSFDDFPDYIGNIYAYFGGKWMDDIPDLVFTIEYGIFWEDENFEFSGVGDVNNDRFNDILIGSPMKSVEILNIGPGNYTYFQVGQNYPNPFVSLTTIKYLLPEPGNIVLTIYDLSGQELEVILDGFQTSGEHEITWQPGDLPDGIYFYRLQAEEFSDTKKLVLIR